MTISNEAIEKAARTISRETFSADARFDALDAESREFLRNTARAALEAAAPIIRAECLDEAAEAIDWIRPEMGPGINITPYREGRNDALTSAASWLRARAVAERGNP